MISAREIPLPHRRSIKPGQAAIKSAAEAIPLHLLSPAIHWGNVPQPERTSFITSPLSTVAA
jgi:hypothetical protein